MSQARKHTGRLAKVGNASVAAKTRESLRKQPAWPPGLGWGKSQLTPEEYDEAVASLWKDADPQAQQVLRACGIEPPDEEEPDPRTVLHRYLARYKSITQQHRGLVAKKAQLQLRADKIKAQFEKLVQDLADVSKEIEQAEKPPGDGPNPSSDPTQGGRAAQGSRLARSS